MNKPPQNEPDSEEADEGVSAEAESNGAAQPGGSPISQQISSFEFTGPIPPPGLLEQYNKFLPNAADRILSMAEKEQEHRHKMQEKLVDSQVLDQRQERTEIRVGQILGFLIGVVSIVAGSYTAISSSSTATSAAGGVIGLSGVAGLVSVFVIGRGKQQKAQYRQLENSNIEDE